MRFFFFFFEEKSNGSKGAKKTAISCWEIVLLNCVSQMQVDSIAAIDIHNPILALIQFVTSPFLRSFFF